jgi:hypothetical protein
MSEHQWYPDRTGRNCSCVKPGCTVRRRLVGLSREQWQAAPRHRWHVIPKAGAHCAATIPPCTGKQLPDTPPDNQ